jgi:hypothetical protein
MSKVCCSALSRCCSAAQLCPSILLEFQAGKNLADSFIALYMLSLKDGLAFLGGRIWQVASWGVVTV